MELSQILGWTATVLFTVCYVPQILKTLKTQTTAGLSLWLFIVTFVANIVALFYAILINQEPLIIKYCLGILFVGITIAVYTKVYLKENKDKHDGGGM